MLSCAPEMYDELWTAGKAMYKLEPAVAVGGEVVIYAPHLDVVSHVHGKYIYEVGYHILPSSCDNTQDIDFVRARSNALGNPVRDRAQCVR